MVERLNTCHPFVLSDVSGTLRNNTRSRTGRSDQTGRSQIRGAPPNWPWPPEPGVRVTPAAGAAPVPP